MDTPITAMSATNQNQEIDDGLKVIENSDGTFTVEWDPCDSRWSVLNGMTSEQLGDMIMEQVKHYLKEHDA
jgi:hypothetical protein